jgi:O-antigen ligase
VTLVAPPREPEVAGPPERAGGAAALSPGEIAVLGVAFLLPVVFAPPLFSPFWAPKMALLVGVAGAGLVVLGRDAIGRDRAALAALGFLVIAGLSALLSDDPVASVVGLHEVDGGLLFVAGCVAMWALGRHLRDAARARLPDALLAGIGLTAGVAWLQTLVHLRLDELGLWHETRAGALQGNPVYLGALAGAALVLVAARARTASARSLALGWLPLTVLLAGAAQLSGSRIALAAGLVAVAVSALAWARSRRGGVRGAAVVAAALVGVGLALLIAPSGGSATARSDASEVGTNWRSRVGIWDMGLQAASSEPLLGVGPGRFRAETSRLMPLDVAQAHGADVLLVDAHDAPVEYLTTTGVLGLLAAGAWLFFAARRARGPLAVFALVMGVTWLLQPQGVDTTPLLLVALGAAAPPPTPADRRGAGRGWQVATTLAVVAGLLVASVFVYGEWQLGQARDAGSQAALDRARPILGFYPVVDSLETEIAIRDGLTGDRAARSRALAAARATVATEPTRPDWWNRLGEVEGEWGSARASGHAFREALRYNPWSVRAMQGLLTLAHRSGDRAAAAHWTARLCRFSEATCPR